MSIAVVAGTGTGVDAVVEAVLPDAGAVDAAQGG